MISVDQIRFRCSSLGNIMTEPRSKSETLSETCKSHLIDLYVEHKYGRREEVFSDAMDKGTVMEQESINLYSKHRLKRFVKNKQRFTDEFLTGEPDIINGEEIIDIKTSMTANTFFRSQNKDLDKGYYWQVLGYMALTGAKKGSVVYCLTNSPAYLIAKEIRFLSYHYEEFSHQWRESAKQIERNNIFNLAEFQRTNPDYELITPIEDWAFDVPLNERCFKFEIERDEDLVKKIYARAKECKEWMKQNLK